MGRASRGTNKILSSWPLAKLAISEPDGLALQPAMANKSVASSKIFFLVRILAILTLGGSLASVFCSGSGKRFLCPF